MDEAGRLECVACVVGAADGACVAAVANSARFKGGTAAADCAAEPDGAVDAAAGAALAVASNTRLEKAASSAVRIKVSLVTATGAGGEDTRVGVTAQCLGAPG